MRREIRKILFATTGLHIGGGIASVNRCILRALEDEVSKGRIDRIDVLSLHDPPDSPLRRSGDRVLARGSRIRFVWQAWRLLRKKPDLLILDHLGLGRTFELPILNLLKPRPTALFIHGTEFWTGNGEARAEVVRRADIVLTNSKFTASAVLEQLPEVEPRLHPVLLCIDPDLVDRWSKLQTSTLSPRENAVLIVSRIHKGEPGKGHEALIDAWPNVRKSVPDARLWVVGDGTGRGDLERRAHAVGAEGVDFLGKISDSELSRRYRQAALFAMPSRQEGFGLVYAEAMWHGLPCVGSSADAGREVIKHGESGAIVPYDDPAALAETLVSLLLDPAGRERMGANARAEANIRFGFERFRKELLSALGITATRRDADE